MSFVMLGNGGHAKSCTDLLNSFSTYSISQQGRLEIGMVIHDTRKITDGGWKSVVKNYEGFILGVGQIHSPRQRVQIVAKVLLFNGHFITLISPHARVSPDATIGKGTVIMPNVTINAGAIIGEYCIINTGAIVEHDAVVGPFCHISTGAVVNGDCFVKGRCFLGSNAVMLNQISIELDTTVGAGSVVTKDITERRGVYVGNPAKLLRTKSKNNS